LLAAGARGRVPSVLQDPPRDPGRPPRDVRAPRAVRGGGPGDRQRARAARCLGPGDDVMAARRRGRRTGTFFVLLGILGVLSATFVAGFWTGHNWPAVLGRGGHGAATE